LTSSKGRKLFVPKFNVLLCAYDTLKLEINFIMRVEWQVLILDEGQRLKNSNSKIFKQCQALRTNFRVLLSGTPLQNNFEELYNLLEFLNAIKFDKKFRKDLDALRSQNLNALGTPQQDQFHQDQAFLEYLQKALKPHLLRRFKRDVIKDMPKRKEVIVRIEMTPLQRQISKTLLGDTLHIILQAREEKQPIKQAS
jgi:chromodomain-helicase-DNA-binding protein 4